MTDPGRFPTAAELESRIVPLYQQAHAHWPALGVPQALFVDRVIERTPVKGDWLAALSALHASDFYLACACAERAPAALAELEKLLAGLGGTLRRVLGSDDLAQEAAQLLRQKLLSPEDGRPRILEYSGRGPLKGWLRATAARLALDLRRTVRPEEPLEPESGERLLGLVDGPELEVMKRTHRPQFEAAFKAALSALDSRERNALRMVAIEGLSLDRIGRFYGVNRSTVSRWISKARESVVGQMRRSLQAQLGMGGAELESFMGLFQSRLEVSVNQLLERSHSLPGSGEAD